MNTKSYRKSSHTVHDLKVHLVWSTKYCYKVLDAEIGERIRDLTRQVCESLYVQIIKGNVSRDHIHLYACLLYTSPSPRDATLSRMPSSA